MKHTVLLINVERQSSFLTLDLDASRDENCPIFITTLSTKAIIAVESPQLTFPLLIQ